MPPDDGTPPWIAAWSSAQGQMAALAGWAQAGQPQLAPSLEPFLEQYRRLFAPPAPQAAATDGTAAALDRYCRAAERHAQILSGAAADAGARLTAALAASGEGAPPITSLRELHALWVDCGEAAWSAVAHGEPFAEAQAELIAALAALGAFGAPR